MAAEGYGSEQEAHVASLIVDVARAYVDLVHGRADFRPHLPTTALLRRMDQSGTRFDADIVRALVHVMGLCPPGSAVRLHSGDLAVVMETSPVHGDQRRSSVRILTGDPGRVYPLHEPSLAEYLIAGPIDRRDTTTSLQVLLLVSFPHGARTRNWSDHGGASSIRGWREVWRGRQINPVVGLGNGLDLQTNREQRAKTPYVGLLCVEKERSMATQMRVRV